MPVNNFKTGTAKYRMQTYKNSFHMSIKIYSISLTFPRTLLNIFLLLLWKYSLASIRTHVSVRHGQPADSRRVLTREMEAQPHPAFPVILSGRWSHHRMLFLGFVWVSKNTEQIHTLRSPPSHPMDLAMMSSDRKIVSCKRLCF